METFAWGGERSECAEGGDAVGEAGVSDARIDKAGIDN